MLARFASVLEEQLDELGYDTSREFPDQVPTIRSIRRGVKLAKQEMHKLFDVLGDQLDRIPK
jgi:hypothetical protein